MRGLFVLIVLGLALAGGAEVDVHHEETAVVARASTFVAVCSKGDLNAVYTNRSDAVKAAQSHAKATGHKTSVKKR